MKTKGLAILAVGLLAEPSNATTIFDITGGGVVCTFNLDGSCVQQTGVAFTGTMTVDINPAPVLDSDSNGTSYALALNGWGSSSFDISWSSGSYVSARLTGENYFDSLTQVWNNYNATDVLFNRFNVNARTTALF